MFTQTHLFEARTEGYHNYRIPGIVTAPDGTLIAHCEARQGQGGDWDPIDILMRRSTDQGATWQPPQIAIDHRQFAGEGIHNFTSTADHITGEVCFVFCSGYARAYMMKSADAGQTFTDPVDITGVFEAFRQDYDWNVCATGPGHGIQLQNGRLLIPVWLSNGGRAHRPSMVSTIYSDDHGATWQRGAVVVVDSPEVRNPSETVAVELSDGRVLLNIRSEAEAHRRLITISPDGAHDWSPLQFDDALLEPVCMASMLGLRHTPGTILFANPDTLEQTLPRARGVSRDRKNLTVKLSRDDCRTWAASQVIEAGPSGYSDLAEAADGSVVCVYEDGYIDHMYDTRRLTAARFSVDWVMGSSQAL